MPCPNALPATSRHTAKSTQRIFSFPHFAHAQPHSTCGTGTIACATKTTAINGALAPSSYAGHGMSQIPHRFAGPCPTETFPNAFLRFLDPGHAKPQSTCSAGVIFTGTFRRTYATKKLATHFTSKDHKMKTLSASVAFTFAAILILAAPARAQHTATLTWTNSGPPFSAICWTGPG
jgi:hypothetical protein